jgi:hypothetical protein
VQDEPRSGQPKTWRTDENVDRVRNLVRSDRRLGVAVIVEELNMNKETVRHIAKEDWGTRIFSAKIVPESWHVTRKNVGFPFLLILFVMQRCLMGSLPVMKLCVFNTTGKQNDRTCSGKHRIILGRKNTHIKVASQEDDYVFLYPQEDSSLWIHGKRTNGKSTMLFGSADEGTGIFSEEKTRSLAW